MFGKKKLLAGLAVGVLALAFTAVGVGAQAAPSAQATPAAGITCPMASANGTGAYGAFGMGPRGGMMGGAGWGMYGDTDVADLLGITQAQIAAERQSGKSLVEIAAAKNVSEDKLIQTIVADRKAQLDELVKANRLTQAQADAMLANMQANVKVMVERTTVGPAGSPRQGMGPGWQSQSGSQSTTPQRMGPGMGRFGLNRG